MRISGTEPSSVILSQTKLFKKVKSDAKKCKNNVKARRECVINPQNDNFNEFYNMENLMLSKHYESTEVDRRTWLHVPSGTLWSTNSDTHQVVEIQNETY